MLTTVHPIALAELRHRVWFSFLSQGLSIRFMLTARSSIVPGTATLISLLHLIPSYVKKVARFCKLMKHEICSTNVARERILTREGRHP